MHTGREVSATVVVCRKTFTVLPEGAMSATALFAPNAYVKITFSIKVFPKSSAGIGLRANFENDKDPLLNLHSSNRQSSNEQWINVAFVKSVLTNTQLTKRTWFPIADVSFAMEKSQFKYTPRNTAPESLADLKSHRVKLPPIFVPSDAKQKRTFSMLHVTN